ncbi:polymeric immunoglobulin receptor-like [Hoplias malabaricus]|uniref:polymeric immunoglobulin receptor-like n=1 Tax=Hoplias malabaricus TaxID=27720 RepID=UPI003461AB2C
MLQPGSSVTIPCPYGNEYDKHRKYWCYHAGGDFNYCDVRAYANTTNDKLVVTESPVQSLFTVTMRDLQDGDTGSYWCGVEINMGADLNEAIFVKVISDPDLSVEKSSVTGQEGGSVSVHCLYSSQHQKEKKQWCRSKDESCYTVGRSKTSQNSSVQLSDDGIRSFTVEMSKLKKSDTGWYWCKSKDLQIPVHLSVTEGKSEYWASNAATNRNIHITVTLVLGLLLILFIVIYKLRKKHNQTKTKESVSSSADHMASPTEDSMMYASLALKNNKSTPPDRHDGVIYSSVLPKKEVRDSQTEDLFT